jgi:hypothetical protein
MRHVLYLSWRRVSRSNHHAFLVIGCSEARGVHACCCVVSLVPIVSAGGVEAIVTATRVHTDCLDVVQCSFGIIGPIQVPPPKCRVPFSWHPRGNSLLTVRLEYTRSNCSQAELCNVYIYIFATGHHTIRAPTTVKQSSAEPLPHDPLLLNSQPRWVRKDGGMEKLHVTRRQCQ